jgi:2-polyprenyl-3-methyl-5-hydroxy-6-metoxy-1,4-benzoquinol methylase
MSEPAFQYVGDELEVFAIADNWKSYLASQIRPFLGRDVLEVGAGIGATMRALCSNEQKTWTGVEPDAALAARAREISSPAGVAFEVRPGTISVIDPQERFDSVIYIDVLEHIEADAGELRSSTGHLRSGGHLIVLSPAHQWLFSPFDTVIGHCRRYTAATLDAVRPPRLQRVRLRYLDSVGMCASLANRVLLKQSLPTRRQIAFWDRRMVPISRILDPLSGFRVGKSILGVWQA